jgi:hypothetical protein
MRYRLLLSTGLALAAGLGLLLFFLLTYRQADVAAVCLLAVHCAGLWLLLRYLVKEPVERRFLCRMLMLTVVLRFSMCIFFDYIGPEKVPGLKADANTVEHWGESAATDWRMGTRRFELPADLAHLHDWAIFNRSAVLFYVFGPSPLLPEVMNVALSASCALAGYVIARRWLDASAGRIAALLIAFWPSLMVWSTQNLKDPIEMAALCWSVCGLLLLRDRFAVPPLLMLVLAWGLGFLFRPYMGLMIIGGELAAIGLVAVRSKTFLAGALAMALTAVTGAGAIVATKREVDRLYGEQTTDISTMESKRRTFYEGATEDRARGRGHSEYIIELRADSDTQAVLQLPLRVPLFLFSPIPVRFGSLLMMGTYPEMLFWYWLMPKLIVGFRWTGRRLWREMVFVVSSLAPILIAFSLSTSISGEAIRYRDVFLPLLLLFAAVGWALQRARRHQSQHRTEPSPELEQQLATESAA